MNETHFSVIWALRTLQWNFIKHYDQLQITEIRPSSKRASKMSTLGTEYILHQYLTATYVLC